MLSINGDRLSHAYIAGGGIVDTIALMAVCSANADEKPCMKCAGCDKASRRIHPDIIHVEKPTDKREIIVDQIRNLKKDAIVVPSESEKKVYIIDRADLMNTNAQNAFLQILEEPPGFTVFILSTETPAALLETVRSRCVEINAGREEGAGEAAADEMANELFLSLEQGNTELVKFMFRLEKLDRDALGRFFTAANSQAVARMAAAARANQGLPQGKIAAIERILSRAKELLAQNVSAGHISGLICASLIDKK